MGELFVGHEEDGFDARIEMLVGHHHREFAGQVGKWPHSADHHPRAALADKFDRQAGKRPHVNVLDIGRRLCHQRDAIFGRIQREWHLTIETLFAIMGQDRLLSSNPLLERSIRNRFPYLDPLNHVQVELLKAYRAQSADEQVLRGIQITINGISAGLRNSG